MTTTTSSSSPSTPGSIVTTLEILLDYLEVRTLIITGMAATICVLFTANDAYMRDYHLVVPADCIASVEATENEHALAQMRGVLKADTSPWAELDLAAMARADECPR